MSFVEKFNSSLHDFIADLKKFDFVRKDVENLETYIEVTKVNSKILIRGFQGSLLRDVFVQHVLKNDLEYFLNYNVESESAQSEKIRELVKRLQNILKEANQSGGLGNSEKIFHWLKVLCFYAYSDLGIDPAEKFKSLMV
tara:strand:+ start:5469 stop:5888 length:420 start_codon:yes stop_codon:yes gene_type:complete